MNPHSSFLIFPAAVLSRYGHVAAVYNERMYIFGGYDDFGLKCNDLHEFDFSTTLSPLRSLYAL